MSTDKTYGSTAGQSFQDFAKFSPDLAGLYSQYYMPLVRQAADMGRQVSNQDARNQVRLDNELLAKSNDKMFDRLRDSDRRANSEYYRAMDRSAQGIDDLYSRIGAIPDQARLAEEGNLLSGSEEASMERGLNRMNYGMGNTTGDALTTASNAMQFGEAGRTRLMENRAENREADAFKPSLLSAAIQTSAAAMPGMRAFDTYGIKTGKNASNTAANFGQGQMSNDFGGTVFGSMGQQGMNAQNNTASTYRSAGDNIGSMPSYS